jgi:hypothetical protein
VGHRDHRFRTSKKRGTNLHAARPESERSGDPATIRDATGSNHRNTHGIRNLGDESHRANQTRTAALGKGSTMSPGLVALRDEGRLQLVLDLKPPVVSFQ